MFGRKRLPAARTDDVPADFGTPVSDSIEESGHAMIEIARRLRRYEPLPLDVLRDYGAPLMRANAEASDRLAALLRANLKG